MQNKFNESCRAQSGAISRSGYPLIHAMWIQNKKKKKNKKYHDKAFGVPLTEFHELWRAIFILNTWI